MLRTQTELRKLGWTPEVVLAAWSYLPVTSRPDKSGYRVRLLVETPDDPAELPALAEELLEISRAHTFQSRARRGLGG